MRPWTFLLLASALAGAEPYASPPGFRVPVSSINTGAALSAVTLHRGLVIAPLGEDHGGGKGDGALAAYDLQDPTKPRKVFDSRDYRDRYHLRGGKDYLGDSSEYHHAILSGDLAIMAERRPDSAGFLILDLAPLYDQDPTTLPTVVSRYTFPGVNQSTNYDGFSFALDWAGGRYVYAPTGSHGLFVVDTEDLANPRLLAHLPNAQLANQTLRAAVALGDLLVLSPVAVNVRGGKVVVMDISDPARPSLTSTFNVDMGYQGFLYGSRFFNVATHTDGISPTRLLAWDLADPRSITEQELLTTTGIKNPEYGYGKDGDLFVGHYPGAMRWSMTQGKPVLVDRIEPQDPPADDYAFISPVGSLVAVTSDHRVRSRLSFAPLDQPDRAPPTLLHARPATGATGVARTAVIGLAFSDFLDTATLDSTAIRLRKAGARTDLPVTLAHLNGVVSVAPLRALDPDTTYEVMADPARLRDQVGNPYNGERILTCFSTGTVLEPFSVEIDITAPVALGGEAVLGIRELAAPGTRLEHAWDLGDGRLTPFGPAASLRHRFTTPGNQVVTLASRRVGTTGSVRRSAVQVVYRPMAAKPPISSGTIDLDPTGATAFVVNPDHGSVAALDTRSLTRRWEVQIGAGAAAVTIAPDGTVWATAAEADLVVALAPRDGAVLCRFPLPKGADPHGVVMAEGALYVACSGLDAVLELDPSSGRQLGRVSVPDPRHLAWDPRRDRLVVPRFLARGQADSTVAMIDRRSMTVVASIPLAPSPGPDGGADGRGSLNYLAAPAISPDLSQAWIPAKKDNLTRGPAATVSP